MRAASRGHMYAISRNFKKSQLFENLNDANIISMPMFATCKVKMERNYFVHEKSQKSTFVFWRRVSKFGENFSWKQHL